MFIFDFLCHDHLCGSIPCARTDDPVAPLHVVQSRCLQPIMLAVGSMPLKQLSKLIRAEPEFAQTIGQSSFMQCVARMRLVE